MEASDVQEAMEVLAVHEAMAKEIAQGARSTGSANDLSDLDEGGALPQNFLGDSHGHVRCPNIQ